MSNVIFKKLYPSTYTSEVSTRVSNALLVGKLCYLVCWLLFMWCCCVRCGYWTGNCWFDLWSYRTKVSTCHHNTLNHYRSDHRNRRPWCKWKCTRPLLVSHDRERHYRCGKAASSFSLPCNLILNVVTIGRRRRISRFLHECKWSRQWENAIPAGAR